MSVSPLVVVPAPTASKAFATAALPPTWSQPSVIPPPKIDVALLPFVTFEYAMLPLRVALMLGSVIVVPVPVDLPESAIGVLASAPENATIEPTIVAVRPRIEAKVYEPGSAPPATL